MNEGQSWVWADGQGMRWWGVDALSMSTGDHKLPPRFPDWTWRHFEICPHFQGLQRQHLKRGSPDGLCWKATFEYASCRAKRTDPMMPLQGVGDALGN